MARPKAQAPARQYHISGKSVVRIDGRDIYLGKHDSPESIARYAVLISIYQANGMTLPEGFEAVSLDGPASTLLGRDLSIAAITNHESKPILVRHVTAVYLEHVKEKYANSPQECRRYVKLCRDLDLQHGNVLASDFGPVRLKEFRNYLVSTGLSRTYVNRLTRCVVAMFAHAVSGELLDVNVVARLKTLVSLRNGQTSAPETDEVEPANLEHVRATAVFLSPIIKSMLRIQIATGMRPKEICVMRPCDIDRSGEVWFYSLSKHKTSWRGKRKTVPLVGDARDAIIDYLQRDPEAYCFSPAEAMAWRRTVGASKRTTPLNQGNRKGTNVKADPKRTPRDRYDACSYRQAIARAAKLAKVPHWHPYQCRHLTATVVRAAFGCTEEAQALLGHSNSAMTAHYARESLVAATRAAKAAPNL